MPCKHNFFPEAIEKWLKEESNLCPVCRYSFEYKEIISSQEVSNQEVSNEEVSNQENFNNLINQFAENFLINLNSVSYHEYHLQEILLDSYNQNNN